MNLYQKIYKQVLLLEKTVESSSEVLAKIKQDVEALDESNRILSLIDCFENDPTDKNLSVLLMYFERKLQIALKDEDFLKITSEKKNANAEIYPLILVLDNLRSAWNIGSIIRNASAFGVEQVRLYGYSAGLENEKVKKAAMGSDEWTIVKDINTEQIEDLKKQNYIIYGLETDKNADSIAQARIEKKSIFIFW